MKRTVAAALLALTLAACAGSAAPAVVEYPVTRTGSGIMASAPFALAGGDYRADWTAQADSHVGCFHAATLRAVSGNRSAGTIVMDTFDDAAPHAGSAYAYGVPAGQYYVDASSGCAWTVTLTRQ